MKIVIFGIALWMLGAPLLAQDYVDLIKLSGNNTNMGNLKDDYITNINNYKAEIYLPVRVNENFVVITGRYRRKHSIALDGDHR